MTSRRELLLLRESPQVDLSQWFGKQYGYMHARGGRCSKSPRQDCFDAGRHRMFGAVLVDVTKQRDNVNLSAVTLDRWTRTPHHVCALWPRGSSVVPLESFEAAMAEKVASWCASTISRARVREADRNQGADLSGNTFWEFKDHMNANRLRRIVQYSRKTYYSDVKISRMLPAKP